MTSSAETFLATADFRDAIPSKRACFCCKATLWSDGSRMRICAGCRSSASHQRIVSSSNGQVLLRSSSGWFS